MYFKILSLAFKAIHALAPAYISDLLALKTSPPTILDPTRAFYARNSGQACISGGGVTFMELAALATTQYKISGNF